MRSNASSNLLPARNKSKHKHFTRISWRAALRFGSYLIRIPVADLYPARCHFRLHLFIFSLPSHPAAPTLLAGCTDSPQHHSTTIRVKHISPPRPFLPLYSQLISSSLPPPARISPPAPHCPHQSPSHPPTRPSSKMCIRRPKPLSFSADNLRVVPCGALDESEAPARVVKPTGSTKKSVGNKGAKNAEVKVGGVRDRERGNGREGAI